MIEKLEFLERTGSSTYEAKPVNEVRAVELAQLLDEPALDSFYAAFLMSLTVLGRVLVHEDDVGLAKRLHAMDWLNEVIHLVAGQLKHRAIDEPAKRCPPDTLVRGAFERVRKGGFEHSLEWCISRPLMVALSRAGLISGSDDLEHPSSPTTDA